MFKCVYSVVGPSIKVVFTEKSTCESREQCTGPSKKRTDANVVSKLTLRENLDAVIYILFLRFRIHREKKFT